MRKTGLAVACAVALLIPASAAAATPIFGFTEDAPKYAEDGGEALARLAQEATGRSDPEFAFTVTPDLTAPGTIPEKGFLDRSLPVMQRLGIRIVFAVYPSQATAISVDPGTRIALFAGFLQLLARTYPYVREFIVANEPNQPRFWQPQFDASRQGASGPLYQALLAASYDALKAVNPAIQVLGMGLSPRGNDNPTAPSNISTSPVRFLRDVGQAYRRSGRTTPLMDGLALHLYPPLNTYPPDRKVDWPNVFVPNLDRIKQAIWDAFNGTAQPTFAESPASLVVREQQVVPLYLKIAELGWQAAILEALRSLYTGTENVPTVDEDTQARYYAAAIAALGCDPVIREILLFHLIDETDLNRFQSGLLRADRSKRPSFDAVKQAIRSLSCPSPTQWRHSEKVIGARTQNFRFILRPGRVGLFAVSAYADENALGRARVLKLDTGESRPSPEAILRAMASSRGVTLRPRGNPVDKLIKAHNLPRFELRVALVPGRYIFALRMNAEMNTRRTSLFVSNTIVVR